MPKKHTVTYLEVYATVRTEVFECDSDDPETLAKAAHRSIHPDHMYQLEKVDDLPVPYYLKCK